MKIKEVMNSEVVVISPDSSITDAAKAMKDKDVGSLPVCDGNQLVGMVTDRDMVIRGLAEGPGGASTKVSDVMTSPIVYCFDDQDAEEIARTMEVKGIRRLVVITREKKLAGIISLDDLARNQSLAGEVLSRVSASKKKGTAA
jgi:CBS domain-containing protein